MVEPSASGQSTPGTPAQARSSIPLLGAAVIGQQPLGMDDAARHIGQFARLDARQQLDYLRQLLAVCTPRTLFELSNIVIVESRLDFVSYLPYELAELVFAHLDLTSLASASLVCRSWRAFILGADRLWRSFCKDFAFTGYIQELLKLETQETGAIDGLSQPAQALVHAQARMLEEVDKEQTARDGICRAASRRAFILAHRTWHGCFRKAQEWYGVDHAQKRFIRFGGHELRILSIEALGQDRFVTGSQDRSVRVWDLNSLSMISRISSSTVSCLHTDPKNQHVYVASFDATISSVSLESGVVAALYRGHTSAVIAFDLSPKHGLMATAAHLGNVFFWNLKTGQTCAGIYRQPVLLGIRLLQLGSDALTELQLARQQQQSRQTLPDTKLDEDNEPPLPFVQHGVDLGTTPAMLHRNNRPEHWPTTTVDSSCICVTVAKDGVVRFWPAYPASTELIHAAYLGSPIGYVDFFEDEMAVRFPDNLVVVYRLPSLTPRLVIRHKHPISIVRCCPPFLCVVSGAFVHVYDFQAGSIIAVLSVPHGLVTQVWFSQAHAVLIVASNDQLFAFPLWTPLC
ncbi:hypothetical protein CAOG_06326 [Capsaspora owczarzaki ATCC 30864]|uniref:F-box domain-containing protein n=1 Tax=Capsaspora owczarzaki (strain ATCC 30864) TaxID=595528 RepID=A0A0D2X4E9_CAPO3|nr:hypothetical protein CAOG_06326 [Capsaspora owczarzaki ATCC 30864]KJE95939.1 hypothetical protein CAOG_006326 [Capsaspora owczarzaki ATCC 30864]|eukprot:XP_004345075.2 hypothetical protein CAOG_06326 [Capsaspora owczarzaki ATCC 30864]